MRFTVPGITACYLTCLSRGRLAATHSLPLQWVNGAGPSLLWHHNASFWSLFSFRPPFTGENGTMGSRWDLLVFFINPKPNLSVMSPDKPRLKINRIKGEVHFQNEHFLIIYSPPRKMFVFISSVEKKWRYLRKTFQDFSPYNGLQWWPTG